MKHTKGKWEVKTEYGEPSSIETKKEVICEFSAGLLEYPLDLDEIKANAKLISKAPEMYEALKECYSFILSDGRTMYSKKQKYAFEEKIEQLIKEIES